MTERDSADRQRSFAGRYLARRDDEVIASAATYDELADALDSSATDWTQLVIEYVAPTNVVCVY